MYSIAFPDNVSGSLNEVKWDLENIDHNKIAKMMGYKQGQKTQRQGTENYQCIFHYKKRPMLKNAQCIYNYLT